jgi:putative hydrolase of HD superfamily
MERDVFYPLTVPDYCKKTIARVINALYEVPRTNFRDRLVKSPETVGEHIDATILLAERLFPNRLKLLIILKIHDWAQFITGDRRTDYLVPKENRTSKAEKKALELAAMIMICDELGPFGEEIFALWKEFEAGETEDAKIAIQINHAQSILKAYQYEQAGQPIIAKEFYDYYQWEIVEPLIINELATIGFS